MSWNKKEMKNREVQNLVKCPYMPEHVMAIQSLMTHLNRCKATNKHLFKSCIYNCLHVIPIEKYDEHVKYCEDREHHEQEDNSRAYEEESWEQSFAQSNQDHPNKKNSKKSSDSSQDGDWLSGSSSSFQAGYEHYDYDDMEESSLYNKDKLMFYRPGYYYKNQQRKYTPVPIIQMKYPPSPNKQYFSKKPNGFPPKTETYPSQNRNCDNREPQPKKPQNNLKQPSFKNKQLDFSKKAGNFNQSSEKDTHSQSSGHRAKSCNEDKQLLLMLKEVSLSVDQGEDQFGDILATEASMLKKERALGKRTPQKPNQNNWSILKDL